MLFIDTEFIKTKCTEFEGALQLIRYSNDMAANFGWRRRLLLQFMRVRARKRRALQ